MDDTTSRAAFSANGKASRQASSDRDRVGFTAGARPAWPTPRSTMNTLPAVSIPAAPEPERAAFSAAPRQERPLPPPPGPTPPTTTTAVVIAPKPVVPLLQKYGTADKVFLGTVAPSEAELEQAVMAYRAKLYEPWQRFPWSIYPNWMRGGTVAQAETMLRVAVATGTQLAPMTNTKGLVTTHGTGVLPFQEDNLQISGILPFSPYLLAIKSIRQHQKARALGKFLENPELMPLLEIYDDRQHTPDFAGWMNYLAIIEPEFTHKLRDWRRPALFPAHPRKFHSYIAAPNGWGKSELLKALAFHDVQHETGGLVVIDPIGDTAKQIARFPDLATGERLVKLKPGLIPDHFPCINPLEKPGLNQDQKAAYAETLGATLALISDNPLTGPMTTLATACVRVLLDRPGSTLLDLADLLLDPPRPAKNGQPEEPSPRTPLYRLACIHRDPEIAKFFRYEFDAGIYKNTKSGLRNRLRGLLLLPSFRAMTCGPSTVDLEAMMEARKVVLFDLSPLGKQGRFAFGRLLLSLIEDIGLRRERLEREDRTSVQVIIDEASFMISPTLISMINNLRKFGIHLTLAQQVAGQNLDTDSKRVLLSVGVKIAGSAERSELAQMFGEHARELGEINRGEFWVKWGEAAPVRLTVRSDLADKTYNTTEEEWQATIATQAQFYRLRPEADTNTEPEETEAPETSEAAPSGRRPGREQWSHLPKNAPWQSLKVEG
ncbi:hypothetical protein [Methylobacterium indicum]|uniref:hypothetical protein n=1 Tax=Methylobacterium indicum TaxID=1775910 RepID=UPI000B0950F5|nr:hypothetical protein [Methylobacterium indicum]